jgi:membrane protease YdiL (CAAX protease family)
VALTTGHAAATRLEAHLRAALGAPQVPEPGADRDELRRRRAVVAAVTVVGAAVLGWSLNVEPGSGWFYAATLILASVWTAGAFASGPLHLGRVGRVPEAGRPVVPSILLGLALAAVFVLGGLVVREVRPLGDAVDGVLTYARQGVGPVVALVTIVNGIAEELFFRGAMFAAVPARKAVLVTTVVYTLASVASGNLMLGFAAMLLGVVVGMERRASGGVLAPILTHVTWSTTMVLVLPPLFG